MNGSRTDSADQDLVKLASLISGPFLEKYLLEEFRVCDDEAAYAQKHYSIRQIKDVGAPIVSLRPSLDSLD